MGIERMQSSRWQKVVAAYLILRIKRLVCL
jgi:hypothetical protein